MKRTIVWLGLLGLMTGAWMCMAADNLVPPGPPGSVEARMKSLDEVEPRKIITELPFVITNAGSYYLGSSLLGATGSNGIEIATSDVQIDLSGFALSGSTQTWHGIYVSVPADNITIRNGVIRNWGRHGINASNAASVVVSHVTASKSGWGGIYVGKNAMIERCTITGGGNNFPPPMNPPMDDAIQAGSYSTVSDCKIQNNGGAGVHTLSHTRISGCTITDNRKAEGIFAEDYCVIEDCVCAQNGNHGILVMSNCRVINNTCGENATNSAGIQVEGNNNVIEGNNVMGNATGISIPPDKSGNLVIRNTASRNTFVNYDCQGSNHVGQVIMPTGNFITNSNPWANFGF